MEAIPGPVDAIPRDVGGTYPRAGMTGAGARAAGDGAVDAGPAPVCLRSAAWRIWSLLVSWGRGLELTPRG